MKRLHTSTVQRLWRQLGHVPRRMKSSLVASATESTSTTSTSDPTNNNNNMSYVSINFDRSLLDRALARAPDNDWDQYLLVDSRRQGKKGIRIDGTFSHHQFLREYDRDQNNHHPFSPINHNSHFTNYNDNHSYANMLWKDKLYWVSRSAELLTQTSPWTTTDWIGVEDLLTNVLVPQETIRTVVLSFLLWKKALLELGVCTAEQNDDDNKKTTHRNHSVYKFLYHPRTLHNLVNTWRKVYTSEHKTVHVHLTECQLDPHSLASSILKAQHQFGIGVSEYLLHLLLEADVAVHPGRAPEFGDALLDHCLRLHHEQGLADCAPTTRLLNLMIHAWTRANRKQESMRRVEQLLEQMEELECERDKVTYRVLFPVYAQEGSWEAAERANQILQEWLNENEDHGPTLAQPDVFAFAMVANAYQKSKRPEAVKVAIQLYERMKELRKEGKIFGTSAYDPALIHTILNCYGNDTMNPGAAAKAAEEFYRSTHSPPRLQAQSILMQLYSKAGDDANAERLRAETEAPDWSHRRPDFKATVALLSSYAKSKNRNRIEKATALLERMELSNEYPPNRLVYNAFLGVLASDSSPSSRVRAEETLQRMKVRYQEGDESVRPDVISYATVMNGWAQAGHPERAREILGDMFEDYRVHGNEAAKPDTTAFNTVLAAYGKSKSATAPIEAENFLLEMKKIADEGLLDIQPDVYSVSNVLKCYTNFPFDRFKMASKAQKLLFSTKDWTPPIVPNRFCYNHVMEGWGRTWNPNPLRAVPIFNEMCRDYRSGNDSALPDVSSYNILIKCHAFSRNPNAPQRAEEIVEQMNQLAEAREMPTANVRPNVRTYTALLMCYGLAGQPKAAMDVVVRMDRLYEQGKLSSPPNSFTFKTLIEQWEKSREPDKERVIQTIKDEMARRFSKQKL